MPGTVSLTSGSWRGGAPAFLALVDGTSTFAAVDDEGLFIDGA